MIETVAMWVTAALLATLIFQGLRLAVTYGSVYSLSTGVRRQLPLHVLLVATSYVMSLTVLLYLLVTNAESFDWWYVLLCSVIAALGHWGLWNVMKYERRKLVVDTGFIDPTDPEKRLREGR